MGSRITRFVQRLIDIIFYRAPRYLECYFLILLSAIDKSLMDLIIDLAE